MKPRRKRRYEEHFTLADARTALHAELIKARISASEMAWRLGLDPSHFLRVVKGERALARKHIPKIAEELDVPPERIVGPKQEVS